MVNQCDKKCVNTLKPQRRKSNNDPYIWQVCKVLDVKHGKMTQLYGAHNVTSNLQAKKHLIFFNTNNLICRKYVSNYFCFDAICTDQIKDLRQVCKVLDVKHNSMPQLVTARNVMASL